MPTKAIVAGASGLIGGHLLHILLNEAGYDEVLVLVRKELPFAHPKLKQLVIDFTKLDNYTAQLTADAVFCCLGTTQKKTPDLSEYRRIDHDYPLQLGRIAQNNHIRQYHLVSAAGANAASSVFYLKLKGETEDDLVKVGLPSLHIYRPWFLTGSRKEGRPLEMIARGIFSIFNPLLGGRLRKYRSIAGSAVASAMYKQSLKKEDGLFIYASDQIQALS